MTNENLTPPSSPNRGRGHLSASTLKIIACIFMTVDHVGVHILPHVGILRVLGRVAFPIFAYFIAEGCRYTRNKPKRLLLMSLFGVLFEAAYFLYDGYVKGDLNGTLDGHLLGRVDGDVNGDVLGDIGPDAEVGGDINGNVDGDINGHVCGNVNGCVSGKINGRVDGQILGTVGV